MTLFNSNSCTPKTRWISEFRKCSKSKPRQKKYSPSEVPVPVSIPFHGCPWTSEVSVQASIPSQCPMVHVGSHGCPWTSEVLVPVSHMVHVGSMDDHGPVRCLSQCPMAHVGSHGMLWDRVTGHPMDSAGTSGHLIVPIDCC